MSPLSGGGEPVRSSVREEGHRGRAYTQGAVKGTGGIRRMRRVVGGRIPVESYDDSTWEGGGDTSAMEHPGHRGWASDLQDDLPGEGRPVELSSGGMPGQSGGEGGNAGAILARECPRHCGNSGRRKNPPPTVRPMRHAGPQAGPEQAATGHGTVCKGGGAEETMACRDGDEGEFGAGLQGLRGAYKY